MLKLPVIRWGQPYESLEVAEVNHFATGEPIAKVCQANGGIIRRDMQKAQNARAALRRIPHGELIAMLAKAKSLALSPIFVSFALAMPRMVAFHLAMVLSAQK